MNSELILILILFLHTRTPRGPPARYHRPVDGDQILAPRSKPQNDGREITTLRHDTTAHDKEDPWCVERMWVPPAQVHQGEKLVDALLTGCQQPNFRNGVDFVHRRVAALNSGVPSQSLARDYELDANLGNVGKPCKRHRLPFSRARQRISP